MSKTHLDVDIQVQWLLTVSRTLAEKGGFGYQYLGSVLWAGLQCCLFSWKVENDRLEPDMQPFQCTTTEGRRIKSCCCHAAKWTVELRRSLLLVLYPSSVQHPGTAIG